MNQPADSARDAATRIITDLRAQGHTAYLAGGCVRDALLGKAPKDYDVATDATPDAVQALFPRSAAVGAAFGVVIVYTPAPKGRPRFVTEVATFRAEGTYSDGRRPDEVRFTNAEEDAKRRDFTINGLFADPLPNNPEAGDTIIDYVNGQADLSARVIRAIGDPGERFGEDYLRMLRAVRFAARLGFEIDPTTSAAIRAHARYLGQISRERIGQELLAMLAGPDPARALNLLQQHKLDGPTLNEDPADPLLAVSDQLPAEAEPATRLVGWLIDRYPGDANQDSAPKRTIDRWRKALTLSNDHRDAMGRLFSILSKLRHWPDLSTAARKRIASRQGFDQALLLREATSKDAQPIRDQARQLTDDGIGLSPAPLLTGDDLIANGLQPSPAFKRLLDDAYDQQLEGKLRTREDAIAWLREQLAA